MITLDATLKTAQDGVNHRPIAEIISSPMGEIIPTAGNYFNALTAAEREPHIITLSTGRLAVVLERQGVYNELKYLYTPTDRSHWIEVDITTPYAQTPQDPCICELTNGNIGLIYTVNQTQIWYNILSPTGVEITANTLLYDGGTNWIANPYVITLANNTYLLVYPEGTGAPPSESNTYYLKQRTSSNFTSWGSSTDITPSEFASTRYCNNPHLLQVTSGRIFLHLDYLNQYTNETELNNIYQMISDNNGSTWSSATKITNYTTLGLSATHPTAAEKDDGDISFMYADKSVVKTLDYTMTGFPCGGWDLFYGMNYDPDANELHILGRCGSGNPWILVTLDALSWTYKNSITTLTIPPIEGYPTVYYQSFCEWSAFTYDNYYAIQTYNHINEISRIYKWGYSAGGGATYIVTASCGYADLWQAGAVVVEHDGKQKLFILHHCYGYGSIDHNIGWIDLNEVADPITGLYEYHEVYHTADPGMNLAPGTLWYGHMRWDYVHDYLMILTGEIHAEVPGIFVLNPETGGVILQLNHVTNSGFPRSGVRDAIYIGDDVYFGFEYYSGEPDRRGLGHWQADTGTVIYHVPPWATVDDYMIGSLTDMGDGRILMHSNNTLANGGGIAIYDTNTGGWEIFNDDNYPGFGHTDAQWGSIQYDPITKTIYAIYMNSVIAFSEYGPYSLLKQTDIDNVDSTVDYGDYITWSYNFFEYQPNITIDENGVLWAVWQHLEAGSEYSAKWANLLDDVDLSDDISINNAISITWDIEKPAKLEVSFAKGHLYDPQNLMSTLSPFLRKGRKLVVRFGEMISDTEYWQDQGEYCIKSVALVYSTSKYPDAKVVAEDSRVLWEDNEVVATMYYDDETPYNVLEDILTAHAELDAAEFTLPSPFQNAHNLHYQFLDMNLDDIVKDLLDHFGYFSYVNMSGKYEPRYIDLEKATDHVYSDTVKLIEYSPNDEYSTFINRVIVKGISHVYSEVLYEEECVTFLSGTTGFWGKSNEEKVWYSDDHQDTCRYPRLEIIESVANANIFGIKMGGGHESITDEDDDEHYVIVTIEAPDLSGAFIVAVAALVAVGIDSLACDEGGFFFSHCGWYIFSVCMLLNVVLYILGAIASYNYNIWARPIGDEKSTFQSEPADDTEFQKELGNKIIPVTIDDPMAYTVAICQTIADHELSVVMAQRRRLKFKKTAHLQDEIGDILELIHPYSGEVLKIFVPKLKRTMRVGKYFNDEINGWRIMS